MRIILLTISFLFLLTSILGQTCTHDDLSHTLRFKIESRRPADDSTNGHDCTIIVTIINKASRKKIQIISFKGIEIYSSSFTKCSQVRSRSTWKNWKAPVMDTDFGDLVVADFNFDSREDLAIRSDDENSGTYYRFYIQGKDGSFTLDPFLTDSVSLVPTYFNPAKKTLTTYQVADVGHEGEQVYRLDVRNNRWSMIRHRFIRFRTAR